MHVITVHLMILLFKFRHFTDEKRLHGLCMESKTLLPFVMKMENGKSRNILTMTVAEVYQFKNEYPDVTIGKSKFSSLHPMEVKLSSAVSRNVCNYIYHSNVNLILETLHSDISNIFPLHSDQLVKEHEIKNETCM